MLTLSSWINEVDSNIASGIVDVSYLIILLLVPLFFWVRGIRKSVKSDIAGGAILLPIGLFIVLFLKGGDAFALFAGTCLAFLILTPMVVLFTKPNCLFSDKTCFALMLIFLLLILAGTTLSGIYGTYTPPPELITP